MKLIRRLSLVLFFIFFLGIGLALAFDNIKSHPDLSRTAGELFNQSAEDVLNSEELNWIAQGSIDEDTDPRYLNHYYDPSTGKGLNEGLYRGMPAKDWAKYQFSTTGDYSVSAILANYRAGRLERAYQGVGHILHLIQDMAVPAHTRNDAHAEGDSFEEWAHDNGKIDSRGISKISANSLDQVFDSLAFYSHNNFFSKDTVPEKFALNYKRVEQKINGKRRIYLVNNIENFEYKIAYSQNPDSIVPVFSVADDYNVHADYWKMLYPKAVGYSAGVIEYFTQEFARIDQEKQDENLSLWQRTWRGFMAWNRELNYIWGDAFMTSRLSAGQMWNSLFGANQDDDLIEDNNQPEESVGAVLADRIIHDEEDEEPEEKEEVDDSSAPIEEASLKSVIDGDTIVLTDGRIIKYLGINAPELGAPGSQDDECLAWVARLRNLELLQSGKLKLIKDSKLDVDSAGNFLRYVYAGDTFLNAVMGREGLAKNQFCPALSVDCQTVSDTARQKIIKEALNDALVNKRGLYSGVCGTAPKLISQTQPASILNNETPDDSSDDQTDDSGSDESSNPNPSETDPVVVNESNNDYLKQFAGSIPSPVNSDPEFKISAFNIFDLVSGNIYYSASTSVGVDIESSGSADAYFFSTASTTPGLGDSGWLTKAPETFSLPASDGLKQVYLWVKKDNKIISSASSIIYLDTIAPQIIFSSAPPTWASSATSTFVLATNEVGSALRYYLDSEAWQSGSASTSIIFDSLSEGAHILSVEGMDLAGNIGTSSYSWLIDHIAPGSLILNLNSEYPAIGFTVEWQGNDTGTSTPSEIKDYDLEYQVDAGDWQSWLSATASTSAVFSQSVVDGAVINFRVRARDRAGNLGAWSVIASTKISEPDSGVNHVVISKIKIEDEVYDYLNHTSELTPNDEFVELYNPTANSINLTNYRLARKTKSGKEYNLLTKFPDVNLPAYSYFLIAHPTGYTNKVTPDAVYSSASYSIAHDNTVILYDANGTVQDKVGFGEASDYEGAPFSGEMYPGDSLERKAAANSTWEEMGSDETKCYYDCAIGNSYDTDNNNSDFIAYFASPKNSQSDPEDPKDLLKKPLHQWLFDQKGGGKIAVDGFGSDNLTFGSSTIGESYSQLEAGEEIKKDFSQEIGSQNISMSFWFQGPEGEKPMVIQLNDDSDNNIFGVSAGRENFFALVKDEQNKIGTEVFNDPFWHWFHFVLVYDQENSKVLVYINGELQLTLENQTLDEVVSKINFSTGSSSFYFYNLSIWGQALSQPLVEKIYHYDLRENSSLWPYC